MCNITFSVINDPRRSHLDSIRCRAELPLEVGVITAMPEITIGERAGVYVSIILTIPECDKAFWLGFCEGIHFTRSNRQLVLDCSDDCKCND